MGGILSGRPCNLVRCPEVVPSSRRTGALVETRRDERRLREVYAASYPRLVGQLVGVTGDPAEAEDVVMEAFARAAPRRSSFHEADNPEAWLRTVAVNVARSRWRRMLRWAHLLPELVTAPAYADLPEDRLSLLAALRQLPAAQREAIALHHLADLRVAEVALTLGVPEGTVKARLSRGRTALAELLSDSSKENEDVRPA
jgi:RNA polymerase sigma-70 factor, ECF subfamily